MTYELAKQLKDAGFPQEMYITCKKPFLDNNHDCRCDKPDCILNIIGTPNLSELIEACGKDFCTLTFFEKDNLWGARAKYNKGLTLFGQATPEEAVAKLWLELNKK